MVLTTFNFKNNITNATSDDFHNRMLKMLYFIVNASLIVIPNVFLLLLVNDVFSLQSNFSVNLLSGIVSSLYLSFFLDIIIASLTLLFFLLCAVYIKDLFPSNNILNTCFNVYSYAFTKVFPILATILITMASFGPISSNEMVNYSSLTVSFIWFLWLKFFCLKRNNRSKITA